MNSPDIRPPRPPRHPVAQYHLSARNAGIAKQVARGKGLSSTTTGTIIGLPIDLAPDHKLYTRLKLPGPWNIEPKRFVYVWNSNEDQIFAAEVWYKKYRKSFNSSR